MRSVDIKLPLGEAGEAGARAPKTFALPVSFAASMLVAEHAGDPLTLAISQAKGEFQWNTLLTVKVVYAGIRAAGEPFELEEVGDAVVAAGVFPCAEVAAKYISALVAGSPERPVLSKKKSPAK